MRRFFEFPRICRVSVQYGTVRYLVRASNELLGTRHCGILKKNAAVTRTELRNVTSYERTVRYFVRTVRNLAP